MRRLNFRRRQHLDHLDLVLLDHVRNRTHLVAVLLDPIRNRHLSRRSLFFSRSRHLSPLSLFFSRRRHLSRVSRVLSIGKGLLLELPHASCPCRRAP